MALLTDVSPSQPRRLGEDAESPLRGLLSVAAIDDDSPRRSSRQHEEPNENVSPLKEVTQKQLRHMEVTFENLLDQTVSSMRKDLVSREERINRRMETESKEQKAALFELRRELAQKQKLDIDALEDRLSRRLDQERSSQKATLSELRRESNAQLDMQAQLAAFRHDLSNTQLALTKLAQGRGECEDASSSTRALEQNTAAAEAQILDLRRELSSQREQMQVQGTDQQSALACLRKELEALHSSEAGTLHEQLGRRASSLSHEIQELRSELRLEAQRWRSELEVCSARPGGGASVGRRLEVMEGQLEELGRNGVLGPRVDSLVAPNLTIHPILQLTDTPTSFSRRLEVMEGQLEELVEGRSGVLGARVEALEVSLRDSTALVKRVSGPDNETLSTLRVALDETRAVASGAQREVSRLAKELVEQRQGSNNPEQISASRQLSELQSSILQEVTRLEQRVSQSLQTQVKTIEGDSQGGLASCRAALEEACRSIGRLSQELARERSERCSALADLSCRTDDTVAAVERVERKLSEGESRMSHSMEMGDSASVITATTQKAAPVMSLQEHVALAACVGELNAELRLEISERIQRVVGDLRGEIAKQVVDLQEEIRNFARGSPGLVEVQSRVVRLESARLDLRIGALESAWQRAASLVLTGRQVELGELKLPTLEPAGCGSGTAGDVSIESTCSAEGLRKINQINQLREMLSEQARRMVDDEEGPDTAREQGACGAPAIIATAAEFPQLEAGQADDTEEHSLETAIEDAHKQSAEPAPDDPLWQPLISDELKERLEVLVQQVKKTLDRSAKEEKDLDAASSSPTYEEGVSADFETNPLTAPLLQNNGAFKKLQSLVQDDAVPGPGAIYGYQRHSTVTVGPPVLKSVSISAPRRATSPCRVPAVSTTTTRVRSPSPVRVLTVQSGGPAPRAPPLLGNWMSPQR